MVLPKAEIIQQFDSLKIPTELNNMERVDAHLDDMDHYLRPKSFKKSPDRFKVSNTSRPSEADLKAAEEAPAAVLSEEGSEGPATDEEKREGVKQLLTLLRAQKKKTKKKEKRDAEEEQPQEGAEPDSTKKSKKKKKMMIKDGQLIIIAVNDADDAASEEEEKKKALLSRIVALAEEGDLAQVEALTRSRLAELHGTQPIRTSSKMDLLKEMKKGDPEDKLLKKALFRMSEGLQPKGLEFLLDAAHWEQIGGGLSVMRQTAAASPPSSVPKDVAAVWQGSLDTMGYFCDDVLPGGQGGDSATPSSPPALFVPTEGEDFAPGQEVTHRRRSRNAL